MEWRPEATEPEKITGNSILGMLRTNQLSLPFLTQVFFILKQKVKTKPSFSLLSHVDKTLKTGDVKLPGLHRGALSMRSV